MYLLNLDKTLTFKLYVADKLSTFGLHSLYAVASYFVYLLPIILLVLFFKNPRDRINSAKIFLSAAIAWFVLNYSIGYLLYHYGFRDRPFASKGVAELLFERPQKSFPSDHAAVLFAVMLAFFMYKYPKLGWLFIVGGAITCLARVMIGFHYVGDILGGWAVGAAAVGIVMLLDKPLTKAFEYIFGLFKRSDGRTVAS